MRTSADPLLLESKPREFADSEELVRTSGLLAAVLIQVRTDHSLADPERLAAMLAAYEASDIRRRGK